MIDDAEWRKVEEGVYTGFSQGGAYAKRWRGEDGLVRYTADPSEVSLVDLPCLPSATFQVLKADGAAETRAFAESVRIALPPEPTNAAIFAKADELAVAAGRPGEVGDFVASAREALMKAVEAAALAESPSTLETSNPAPSSDGEVEQCGRRRTAALSPRRWMRWPTMPARTREASARVAAGPVLDALSDLGKRSKPRTAKRTPQARVNRGSAPAGASRPPRSERRPKARSSRRTSTACRGSRCC